LYDRLPNLDGIIYESHHVLRALRRAVSAG
jgi:hypothetical protein